MIYRPTPAAPKSPTAIGSAGPAEGQTPPKPASFNYRRSEAAEHFGDKECLWTHREWTGWTSGYIRLANGTQTAS